MPDEHRRGGGTRAGPTSVAAGAPSAPAAAALSAASVRRDRARGRGHLHHRRRSSRRGSPRTARATTDFEAILTKPSFHDHLLGTDELGRDILSRIIWGARASIQAGVLATLLAIVIAVPIGLVAGYYRGWADLVISRITDVLLAFPFLILAVGLAAILGPSLLNATLAIGIGAVPGLVRIARGEALALREEDYVRAAVVNGASDPVILGRHIVPNMLSTLLVQATVTIPMAIIAEAALSFLGLGVQPPTPSWGVMLADAQSYCPRRPGSRSIPASQSSSARSRSICSATACATSSTQGRGAERGPAARRAQPVGAVRDRPGHDARGRPDVVHGRAGRSARARRASPAAARASPRWRFCACSPTRPSSAARPSSRASICSPPRRDIYGASVGARSPSSSRSR